MEPQTTENDAEPELPLWLRICLRLLCGAATAALLGLFGWWYGDRMMVFAGAVLGFVCGVAYGENALGSFFGAYFNYGGIHPNK